MAVFNLPLSDRFTATSLDLSRLDPPTAIRSLDYETILAERIAHIKELFTEAGIPYDVEKLETDPVAILEEADAYRELLAKAGINDAVRAVMIAFATGSDLDHLGAHYATARAEGESDTAFRRRVLMAPEAFSAAGTVGAYTYHALSASTDVHHVDVWSRMPGVVNVAVQSRLGKGRASEALVETVREYLSRDNIKPLTDVLSVRSAEIIDFSVDLTAYVIHGPSPDVVRSQIITSVNTMASARKTPARDVPVSAIMAAAHVGPVDKVVIRAPMADVATEHGQVPNLVGLNVEVIEYDG